MRLKAFLAVSQLCLLVTLGVLQPVSALTLTSNTTWTDPAPLTDNLILNNNVTLRIISSNGIDGGNFTLTLPNGGVLTLNNGAVINLSAQSGNGNGGNFTVNLAGATGVITLSGSGRILSNGLGSGRGGMVTLNASTFSLSNNALIEAMGGPSNGPGGVVNLRQTSGTITLSNPFTIRTTGLSSATQNLITIEADGIAMDGFLTANGTGNSDGGTITLVAKNGRIRLLDKGQASAQGSGTGLGGTVDLKAHIAGQALQIADCNGGGCSDSGELIKIDKTRNSINIRGGGGTNTGTLRIGRAGSGTIDQDMTRFRDNLIVGPSNVEWGNDGGNTTAMTLSNYNATTDFGASNPDMEMYAAGNITATNNNIFTTVSATANGGNVDITDQGGGILVKELLATGNATVIANGSGNITLENATVTGTSALQTNGAITATNNINLTGQVSINGPLGIADRTGVVQITNNKTLNIGRLTATSTQLSTLGATSDLVIANADISGTSALNAERDISAGATTNRFTGTVTARYCFQKVKQKAASIFFD